MVSEPPLTATVPALVTFPVPPSTEKLVPAILDAPRLIPVTICELDRSIPVVIAPPPEDVIAMPVGSVLDVALLSICKSWFGTVDEAPSARERTVEPVEPFAVVTLKLESVVVSAKVKAISRLSVVLMVLPLLYADCKV